MGEVVYVHLVSGAAPVPERIRAALRDSSAEVYPQSVVESESEFAGSGEETATKLYIVSGIASTRRYVYAPRDRYLKVQDANGT